MSRPSTHDDDEVRTIIRMRLRDGLSCTAPELRRVLGSGGTDRLVRLLRQVRMESRGSNEHGATRDDTESSLPIEIAQQIDVLSSRFRTELDRFRAAERAAANAAFEHMSRAAQARVTLALEDESSAMDNALALAQALDEATERIRMLEHANNELTERRIEADRARYNESSTAQARWDVLNAAYQSLLISISPKQKSPAGAAATTTASRRARR